MGEKLKSHAKGRISRLNKKKDGGEKKIFEFNV